MGGTTENFFYNNDGTPQLDRRGEQINYLAETGNTLYYTRWGGEKWTQPIDIQAHSVANLLFPAITVDSPGTIHLIWAMAIAERTSLMYSQAPASMGDSVRAWSKPILLAADLLSSYYPASITVDPADGLHILFYKIGIAPGVFVINSSDGGENWSKPVQLYANNSSDGREDGSQPVRITSDDKGRLHAAWTVYAQDGNGKTVYYAQSLDQGITWSIPFPIAVKQTGWYEVDWLNVGISGDQVHAVWEGGTSAFNNERISPDGGKSWGSAGQIMPLLVGENGWSDLVTDSRGILHQLLVKRVGAAAGSQIYALWHSHFIDNQWTVPVIVGLANENVYIQSGNLSKGDVANILAGTIMDDGLRYQRSVILNGNELFVIIVNEYGGELFASHTTLDAPRIAPEPFPTTVPTPTDQFANVTRPTFEPTPTLIFDRNATELSQNPGTLVIYSAVPVILLVLGIIVYSRITHQK